MDLPIRIRIIYFIYYVKDCYAIRLKFGYKFLTSLTRLVLEVKASICPIIKENLLLHCGMFLAFVIVVIDKPKKPGGRGNGVSILSSLWIF